MIWSARFCVVWESENVRLRHARVVYILPQPGLEFGQTRSTIGISIVRFSYSRRFRLSEFLSKGPIPLALSLGRSLR